MMLVHELMAFSERLGEETGGSENIDWTLLKLLGRRPRYHAKLTTALTPDQGDRVAYVQEVCEAQWFSRLFESSLNILPTGWTLQHLMQAGVDGAWFASIGNGDDATAGAAKTPALAVCRAVVEWVVVRNLRDSERADPFLHLRKF